MNNDLKIELSVVMPCLNEVETLEVCINKAQRYMDENHVIGEVIIADNGSTDGSQELAEKLGARVINVEKKGYGNALRGGIIEAFGEYVIMGDSDDSYDFYSLQQYIDKLREGYDLVMGNRFKGGVDKGAMPFLHRYLGNPVLTFIGKLFFEKSVGDFHCGLRGFRKDAFLKMDLQTAGMEFATEMVVKASFLKMKITEVPTTLSKDGRNRPPHLNTWRDGWRHLRFMLLYSPAWVFLYPGLLMILFGGIVGGVLLTGSVKLGEINLDVNTLIYMAMMMLFGFQAIFFYLMVKVYAINSKLMPVNEKTQRFVNQIKLERGIFIGILLMLMGIISTIIIFKRWGDVSYGNLNPLESIRYSIPSIILILLGVQTLFFSFFISVLNLKRIEKQ